MTGLREARDQAKELIANDDVVAVVKLIRENSYLSDVDKKRWETAQAFTRTLNRNIPVHDEHCKCKCPSVQEVIDDIDMDQISSVKIT